MIIHINGNYPHHSLHSQLVSKLADLGYIQYIFIPISDNEYCDKYRIERSELNYNYAKILNITDRMFFFKKIIKIAKYIEKSVKADEIDCIIAHTLYSDGGIARLLNKKYKIPYSVIIRNTDINVHMKLRPYLDWFMKKIIYGACNVILITPSYSNAIYRKMRNLENIKTKLIPNPIDNFWLKSRVSPKKMHKPLEILFVGEINRNKNLDTSIRVISRLNKIGISTCFNIVGDGPQIDKCKHLAAKLEISDKISFYGWHNKKEEIRKYYNNSDIFMMLSFRETFGTVYIEALSQGLPIIYTRGQGIDGYFSQGSVGYSCNPNDVEEIVDSVIKIIKNYEEISENCISQSYGFSIEKVALDYAEVIDNMIINN